MRVNTLRGLTDVCVGWGVLPTWKAAAKVMPSLVPTTPTSPGASENRAAWKVLAAWKKPFRTAFSDSDAITK